MKKSVRLISVFVMLVLVSSMILTGCGKKPTTLEEYAAKNSDFVETFKKGVETSGLTCTTEVKGNELIATIDVTEELASLGDIDDSMKAEIKSVFDSSFEPMEAQMSSSIKTIEDEIKISGISIKVVVLYKGETIYERSFTS